MRTALDYLDDLKDDAAVHIWPDDLAKCQTSECVVSVYSVRMGSPDGKTVPLFSREQVQAALQWQAEQHQFADADKMVAASPHGVPPDLRDFLLEVVCLTDRPDLQLQASAMLSSLPQAPQGEQ